MLRKPLRFLFGTHSDGFYHEINALITLVFLTLGSLALAFTGIPIFALGVVNGGTCGLFIDPDLDHHDTTRAEYRARRVFGRFIGTMFQWYWMPYTILGHRNLLTHGGPPPVGWMIMVLIATPLRMLYTFLPLIIPALVYPPIGRVLAALPLAFYVGLWAGWAAQDLVHWKRDYRKWKRRKYKFRR